MRKFFSEIKPIQEYWKVLNNDLKILLDQIPFDLDPEVFEQKYNEIIKTKIFPDSDYTVANIFGFESKTIHHLIAENFDKIDPTHPYFVKLSKMHSRYDKDGKPSAFLVFLDCDKKLYDDYSLSGMPSELTTERLRFFFQTPLRQLFYSALNSINIFNTIPSAEQIEALKQNMPNPSEKIKSNYENCVAIPFFERFRIALLLGNAFNLSIFDGTDLVKKYNTDSKHDKLSALKLGLSVHKIGFIDHEDKTVEGSYITQIISMAPDFVIIKNNSIQINRVGNEIFPPSGHSNDENIVHEFGHSLLYSGNHPNKDNNDNNLFITSDKIGTGTVVARVINNDLRDFLEFGTNKDNKNFVLGPIDVVALKFAEFCSYRFQRNTANGRELNSFFQNSSISKYNENFTLPKPLYQDPFIQDTLLSFTSLLMCLTAVNLILSTPILKSHLLQSEHQKTNFKKNLISCFASINSHATQNSHASLAVMSLTFGYILSKFLYKKSGLRDRKIWGDSWLENHGLKSITRTTNQVIESIPKDVKDEIKKLSEFTLLMTFGELMGDSYFSSSSVSSSDIYYRKPEKDFTQRILPHLVASIAVGTISIISKQFYESLKFLKARSQNNLRAPISPDISSRNSDTRSTYSGDIELTTNPPNPTNIIPTSSHNLAGSNVLNRHSIV